MLFYYCNCFTIENIVMMLDLDRFHVAIFMSKLLYAFSVNLFSGSSCSIHNSIRSSISPNTVFEGMTSYWMYLWPLRIRSSDFFWGAYFDCIPTVKKILDYVEHLGRLVL